MQEQLHAGAAPQHLMPACGPRDAVAGMIAGQCREDPAVGLLEAGRVQQHLADAELRCRRRDDRREYLQRRPGERA